MVKWRRSVFPNDNLRVRHEIGRQTWALPKRILQKFGPASSCKVRGCTRTLVCAMECVSSWHSGQPR